MTETQRLSMLKWFNSMYPLWQSNLPQKSILFTPKWTLDIYYWKFNFPTIFCFVWTIQLVPQFFYIFPEFYSLPLPQYMRLGSVECITWSRSKMQLPVTHVKYWKSCDLIARCGYELILSCGTVQIRIQKRKWNISLSFYPFVSE